MPDPLSPILEIVRQLVQVFWSLLAGLPVLARVLESALWLHGTGLRSVDAMVNSSVLALSIIFLAGVSLRMGESVELFINRVRPRRFVLTLLAAGLITIAGAGIWMGSIWLIGHYVLGSPHDLHHVIWAVSLGYAPLLFGYMGVLPYLGPILERVLTLWSFLTILVAVTFIVEVPILGALLCVLPGWLVVAMLRRFINRPSVRLDDWWWRHTTGTTARVAVTNLATTMRIQAEAMGRIRTGGQPHE